MKCPYIYVQQVVSNPTYMGWVNDGFEVPFLLGVSWNIQICTEIYVWDPTPLVWGRGQVSNKMYFARNWMKCPDMYTSDVSNPYPDRGQVEMKVKYQNTFVLGIVWNIQICKEKLCMEVTPQGVGWGNFFQVFPWDNCLLKYFCKIIAKTEDFPPKCKWKLTLPAMTGTFPSNIEPNSVK